MRAAIKTRPLPAHRPGRALRLCAGAIVVAVCAAYLGSLGGAFLFDDLDSVPANPSIRHLSGAIFPRGGATVSGRPVLNVSFALNYLAGGLEPWGYHALNVAVHAAAALLLLGIIRRTLVTRAAGSRPPATALAVAFAVSLLWALHPLQTESVAYVVQRAESLMGLFYLLTLYAFIRHAEGGAAAGAWSGVAFLACLLGMGTKEAMATAPLLVVLYDRCFVSGTFSEAWRRHRALLLGLAATWIPLALLVAGTGGRAGTAGFGSGVTWWAYLMAQLEAVPHYVRLALWPHPLVGDYGRLLPGTPAGLALGACAAVLAVTATVVGLVRAPALGFLGAWFLVTLAPSSSVVPVSTEIMAEHRMYLPLAAVVALLVLGLAARLPAGRAFGVVVFVVAMALGSLTALRCRVYQGPFEFWSDVASKMPRNAGAWNNLGVIEAARGDALSAVGDFHRALEAAPAFATAHYNLGKALTAAGRPAEAVAELRDALDFLPSDPSVHCGLGEALELQGRHEGAAEEFRTALRLDPGRADACFDLGGVLAEIGDLPRAAEAYAGAVRLSPGYAEAHAAYGNVLVQLGRAQEGAREYRLALALDPRAAEVHNNLGGLLAQAGRLPEARAEFEAALRARPDYADARDNLQRVRALEAQGGHP